MKCEACQEFCHLFVTSLINLIIQEHEQFRPGIIEYKRKISVALQHYIMTIVHIGFGIFQRNVESFSHTVLLSYKWSQAWRKKILVTNFASSVKCSMKILLITVSMIAPILIMKDPKCGRKFIVLASLHTVIYICKTYLLCRMYYLEWKIET